MTSNTMNRRDLLDAESTFNHFLIYTSKQSQDVGKVVPIPQVGNVGLEEGKVKCLHVAELRF